MKYIMRFRTVAEAKASTPISPATTTVEEGGATKVMMCSTATVDEELRVVGDTFSELFIARKTDFGADFSADF